MRAEFFRPDKPDEVVAVAVWDGHRATIETEDQTLLETLQRIFRPSAVSVVEPAGRTLDAGGESVLEPGDLDWFRAAATVRGEREGLGVRFVTETPGGWDPAGMYRSMRSWVADRETRRPE